MHYQRLMDGQHSVWVTNLLAVGKGLAGLAHFGPDNNNINNNKENGDSWLCCEAPSVLCISALSDRILDGTNSTTVHDGSSGEKHVSEVCQC